MPYSFEDYDAQGQVNGGFVPKHDTSPNLFEHEEGLEEAAQRLAGILLEKARTRAQSRYYLTDARLSLDAFMKDIELFIRRYYERFPSPESSRAIHLTLLPETPVDSYYINQRKGGICLGASCIPYQHFDGKALQITNEQAVEELCLEVLRRIIPVNHRP